MIVVLVETDASATAAEVSREALTFGRSLSEAGGGVPVDAVVVGDPSPALVEQLGSYGVRDVHALTGAAFDSYSGAAWAAGVLHVRERTGAVVVTAAGTPRGNEVMAHVAARADVRMAANVLSFSGLTPFTVTRQVVGGAALEEMRLTQRPAVFTVAGHAAEARPADAPGTANVVLERPEVAAADLVARVVSTEQPEPDLSGSLRSARVVVGAGRGAGSADGFVELLELTELLGASLGVSRVVTSLGWRPHHEQVGQTGSRISPDLYIPCGISGAIQHWAGCSSAKTILAINTDAEAPMVTKATYAVIGDLHEVVPAINAELRRRGAGGSASP
jgi:electron transfer flavoprotein alpha subunit